jgi:hypothetical protein
MASIITATTANGLVSSADNSGVLQLASGTGNLVTVPSVTGTAMVSGNMPAFSAYPSSNQNVTTATFTKILFQTEVFDTNNNFANSTFTPTVAGYYQLSAYLSPNTSNTRALVTLYKNGSRVAIFADMAVNMNTNGGSTLLYMNGTTDYVEVWGYLVGSSPQWNSASDSTYFSGCLVRAA